MNTNVRGTLFAAVAAALHDLGLKVAPQTDSGVDAILVGEQDGKPMRYLIQCKRAVTPAILGHLAVDFGTHPERRLLITDYITTPMADELRRRKIQFVDAAGNAFLKRRGLFVFVTGRKRRLRRTAVRTPRVFRPSGLRTTFALLSLPSLVQAPLRDIARAAGVALGSVSIVVEGLAELGFLAHVLGTRRLLHRDRLLHQWTEAYARLLEPTLEITRFAAPAGNWWRHADLTADDAQWGGETAAALLQKYLVPERAIIYDNGMPRRLLSQYRLKADAGGRVVLRRRFWNFATTAPRPDVVPPLLIYADLVAAGDGRSLAAAEQIRIEYLA